MTSQVERDPTGRAGPRRAQVVGVGLIGASLGMALRRQGWHVAGTDVDPDGPAEAVAAGALDVAGDDLAAQVVFVATPAAAAAAAASGVLCDARRPTDCAVSDVSGVKSAIVAAVDHERFVGGHPMAGSEQVGLAGADPDLFVGATWVLTPTPHTSAEAYALVHGVVSSLGADVVPLAPADHDRMVALVSHVPHLVAATLMCSATSEATRDAALLRLAAGGFRDMTRVAAGHPGIWPDICTDNAPAIVAAMDRLLVDLAEMRRHVAGHDRSAILSILEQASVSRRALPARGARPEQLAEVRVPVVDRQGVLAEVTTLAGDLGMNIYDIEIAHSAEGPRGVLVLVVDRTGAEGLRRAIAGRGYACTARDLG